MAHSSDGLTLRSADCQVASANSLKVVLWLTEGDATGLTVHRLNGQAVYVALSANNLPALAELLHAEYPNALILIAADNDENGTGQLRAEAAAKRCNGKPALPPMPGDWNDVFQAEGEMTTQAMLTAFTQPKALSPFESVSEADLKAMSASQKAELLAAHYLNTLAVPVVGEDLCRYEGGAWQVLPYRVLRREIAARLPRCSRRCARRSPPPVSAALWIPSSRWCRRWVHRAGG